MTKNKGQNARLTPIKAVSEALILVGKPFYLILSNLIIGIFFLISALGKLPKIGPLLKLGSLRINLFELKIGRRIKKLFGLKISRFQKLKLKKRVVLIIICLGVFFSIFYIYFSIFKGLPSPKDLEGRSPEISTKIYDRNGNLLYKIYKNQNRSIVPLTQIPMHVRLATLAAEDAEFYSHPGFSIRGIFRALVADFENGGSQGGSTITQQLVKNTLLTPEKTITRKMKEIILSVEVEASYTKDQILEMYLNEVSYGGTAYGIQEASIQYFGKDVQDLSLAEAAFLAGLPKSPTKYSPFGQNPDLAFERQREVLHLMRVNKFITQDQERETAAETLSFVPNRTGIKAPHFVTYVRQLLVDKYGEDIIEKGGLEVTTSLDLQVQEMAEKVVKDEVGKLSGLHVNNGAALVTNPQTGEILAMVGSKNYFDTNYDGQVNVLTRLRQPGSSIKIVNYSYALSKGGYSPASIINDSPITYVSPGSPPYSPVNYDGKFIGNVSVRSALAQSRNIPAVKILASYGVSKMITQGREMGITTWKDPSQYGLSLTLGGGAVTALDLSKVYSTVANSGNRPDLMPILLVKDFRGKVLEKKLPKVEQVLDPRVSFLLTDILKDNLARAPEFGLNSNLVVKDHPEVAVKTGTSNDLRDNWTVGFNQNFLVLTWVGNNDNSPMSKIASGVTGASPIWNKIMSGVLNGQTSIDWKVPEGVVKINCQGKGEWFLKENVPASYCKILPSPVPVDPTNKILDGGASIIRH
ncbi:MAG TPA: transglycosylase domain-containing protein [Patescibacteria group bacterium]|nr:transglycosylase domain-containing protein [Patescibacteria group bacterium]